MAVKKTSTYQKREMDAAKAERRRQKAERRAERLRLARQQRTEPATA